MRHRPIGIGIQGFADALILLRYPFESKEAAGEKYIFIFFFLIFFSYFILFFFFE